MKKLYNFISSKLYWGRNWIIMLWAKVLVFFDHEYDESVIPRDTPYCYTPDKEKNVEYSGVYYTIPCPYYKTLGIDWNGCKFLGIITNDSIFDDRYKMCSVSDGLEMDEEILNK